MAAGLFTTGILLVTVISVLLPRGFWVLDESIRYLQMSSLSESFTLPPPHPFPGGELLDEPAPAVAPLPYHYGRLGEDGLIYSQYSPILALLSLPFADAARIGVYIVPAAGFAAFWLILFLILQSNGLSRADSFLLPLLGTPLLFYGLTFWSHAPAAALVLGAVLATLRGRRSWVPYVLLTAAVLLREEALPLFAIPLLLGRASPRKKVLLLLASASVILLSTRLLTGAWLGTHIQASGVEQDLYGHGDMGYLQARIYVVFMSLVTFLPGVPIWVNAAGGILLFGLWGMAVRGPARFRGAAFYLGLALAGAALSVSILRGFRLFDSFHYLKNPLVVFPALWLVRPKGRLPLILIGILMALMIVMGPMHSEDLAWGSRLTMLPIMSMLVMIEPASRRRTNAVLAAGVLACCAAVGFLGARRGASERLVDHAISGSDAVVITNWMLTGEFAREEAAGMPVYFTSSTADFVAVMSAMDGMEPVVISRLQDIQGQTAAFESAGFDAFISQVVEYDPVLSVAILRSRESAESEQP